MDLKVPPAGESISTVMISEWLVEEGSSVAEDQILVVLETDKINVEVPAPAAGVLTKILKKSGEEADIGESIGQLETGATVDAAPAAAAPVAAPVAATASPPPAAEAEVIVSPAARRLLEENKLSSDAVVGSGKDGRVLKEDVLEYLEDHKKPAPPKPPAPPKKVAAPAAPVSLGEREEIVKMSPLRRKIAERLVEAQQTAAMLTTFNEVDMTAVMDMRRQYKETFMAKHETKLGFMSFFVKAAVEALKAFPAVNSEVRGDSIVYKNHYDIGVAVGGGKGLVVPVLRDADRLSFAGVEKGIKDLAVRAKTMKLTMDDLQGGTFTISNGGVYGSMLSTPILNPPQSGILGLHNIVERPMAVNGKVEIRPIMYVALSYDHRVVDGREAVSFLVALKGAIEDPARLLLEV